MGKHTKGRATFIGANGGIVGFYSFEFDGDGYHRTDAPPGTVACSVTCEQGYLAEMTHDKDGGAFVFRAIELPDEPIMPAARAVEQQEIDDIFLATISEGPWTSRSVGVCVSLDQRGASDGVCMVDPAPASQS